MSYVISFNDSTDKFVMNGEEQTFVSGHLYTIAINEGFKEDFINTLSESHALEMIRSNGVEIELVNIDW